MFVPVSGTIIITVIKDRSPGRNCCLLLTVLLPVTLQILVDLIPNYLNLSQQISMEVKV